MTRPVKRQLLALRRAQIERREAARRARIEREALRRAQIELCVARYGKPTIEEIAAFEMEAAEVRSMPIRLTPTPTTGGDVNSLLRCSRLG
jgi:hypothetical protein